MNLTQFKDRLSHIWWSHMKRANHKILGWLRQSHTGGETETRAVAVGAPKVMRAVTSWAATRCFFGLLRRNSSRMFLASFRSRNAVTRQSLAREMASQVWASTSQQGSTATARSLRGRRTGIGRIKIEDRSWHEPIRTNTADATVVERLVGRRSPVVLHIGRGGGDGFERVRTAVWNRRSGQSGV